MHARTTAFIANKHHAAIQIPSSVEDPHVVIGATNKASTDSSGGGSDDWTLIRHCWSPRVL